MDEKIVQEVLDELFPYFEAAETQSAAVLQFLKEKGIASEEELAPFITRAENASSVRWRAARARISYLMLAAVKPPEKVDEIKPKPKAPEVEDERAEAAKPSAGNKEDAPPRPKTSDGDQKPKKDENAAAKDPS
jgi:hypothetical protein